MNENLITWPSLQKVFIRFFFLFFALFVFIFPLWWQAKGFYEWYMQPLYHAATWLGRHFFQLTTVNFDGKGSGDTTGNYLLLIVISSIALAGTAIWSAIDRRGRNYDKLFYWLVVLLRCYLIAAMALYGIVKFYKTQFPYPTPERLNETFGQSSPMGLAWTFFGYSAAYNYFIGLGEMMCAVLLFFRRTTLLGGLLTLVVTANIMAINYCFDVPVKILSTALFVMGLFIVARDAKRLFLFFFFNRLTAPENGTASIFKNKHTTRALLITKYVLLACFAVNMFYVGSLLAAQRRTDQQDLLIGYYNVKAIHIDQQRPLKADSVMLKWDEIIISDGDINIRSPNQSELSFPYKKDAANHKFVLYRDLNASPIGQLSYQYTEPNSLWLQGYLNQHKISLKLQLHDWEKSQLSRRSFHWINEYPYVR